MRPFFSLSPVLLLWMACQKSVIAASQLRGSAQKLEESPSDPSDRRLQSTDNQLAIQATLTESIPTTTFELRNRLDDPLPLDLTATVPLECETLQLQMNFEMLRGLTLLNLDYLTLQAGSEAITNCISNQNTWKGAVDVWVSFGRDLVAGQVGARIVGSCNGITYDAPLTASVTSSATQYKGVANMEGAFGRVNAITRTKFLGRLDLTSTISSSVSLIPTGLVALTEKTIKTQLEAAFRNQLVKVVEPHLREKLEQLIPAKLIGTINAVVGYLPDLLYDFVENLGMVEAGEEEEFVFEDDLFNFDDDK